MDPLSGGSRVHPTQKNEEAPGRCCAPEQRSQKMAGDDAAVRLICSSGGDTEEWGRTLVTIVQIRRASQTAGGLAVGFGANTKIPLLLLLDELFIFCSL